MEPRRPGGIRRAARFLLSTTGAKEWRCGECEAKRLDRERNCYGDQPPRPLFQVVLPGDRKAGIGPDLWKRCPWKEIDGAIWYHLGTYWDAKAEGAPLCRGPITKWDANAIALSRIVREAQALASAPGREPTTAGQAAAEATRQRLVAEARARHRGAPAGR